jgi:hypothetical protein
LPVRRLASQQSSGRGITKAHHAETVEAADAVGNRVQQYLLAAVKLLGAAMLL